MILSRVIPVKKKQKKKIGQWKNLNCDADIVEVRAGPLGSSEPGMALKRCIGVGAGSLSPSIILSLDMYCPGEVVVTLCRVAPFG